MDEQQRPSPIRQREEASPPPAETDPPAQGQNPFLWLHHLLRGRYRWAVPLAVLFGTALGIAGYQLVPPVYRSTGLLQVVPVLPSVLYQTEDKDVPMFDEYIRTQVRLIESIDLSESVGRDRTWLEATGATVETAERILSAGVLTAERPNNSQMIELSYTHPDPEVARATADAAIEAYMELRRQRESQNEGERIRVLREQKTSLSNQIQSRRDRIHDIADEFGSDALEDIYGFKVDQMQQREAQLNEAESMLAAARAADQGGDSGGPGGSNSPSEMALSELAQIDPQMRDYIARRDQLSDQLQQLTKRFGENHPQVEEVRSELEIAEQRVQQYAQELRSGRLMAGLSGAGSVSGAGMDPERLEARVEELRKLYQKAREEAIEIGRKMHRIERMREELASLQQRLDRTETRIEQLSIESTVEGRIRTLSGARLPETPANTGTRLQATVLGAGAGGGLGFGLVALFGLITPRFRDSADAGSIETPLLGVLPRLPRDLARSNAAAIAADCVHHVRLMLQLRSRGGGKPIRALTITSPDKGTGKTNLALALGLSYASAGARTLLMDCDLTGHGLTRQAEAMVRRRIGEILRREQLVDEAELKQALLHAASTDRPLGEVLIEMDAIDRAGLDRALRIQRETRRGLVDVLEGAPLEECITSIEDEKLSILSAGSGRADDAGRIAPAAFERLLAEARERFDIVLIDTGPLPGGLDASMVAAQADAVLVLASRGDRRRSVEQCIDKLHDIGARIAGLVFNRADADDLAQSSYRSAYHAPSGGEPTRAPEPGELSHASSRFGLLAGAVATMTERADGTAAEDRVKGNGDHPG